MKKTHQFCLPDVAFFADRYYRVRPFDGLIDVSDTSADNSYNKTTRPSAISGSYGVIDGNGNIQQIEATSIVNEDDHTIYNPVTNTTHGITDWTYNYDNRSYDIVSSDGNITVTYGNDNVTIVEPGGTYNVYYVMESASSPTPTPAPVDTPVPTDTPSPVPTVAPHIHSYTSVATRESSCTLAGIRTYTCSECGESYTEQIPATGHTWEIKQDVKTQYDDTGQLIQQGYTIYRCSVCGEEYKEENISSSSVSPIPSSLTSTLPLSSQTVSTSPSSAFTLPFQYSIYSSLNTSLYSVTSLNELDIQNPLSE